MSEKLRFCLTLAPLLLLSGCREPPIERPPAVTGELVSRDPVIVVPDERWQLNPDPETWRFQNRASLVCWIGADSAEPLVIHLRSNPLTAEHHFLIHWDGEPLPAPQIVRDGREIRLELRAEQLTAGVHELQLRRYYAGDAKAVRRRMRNVFTEVSYRHGSRHEQLERGALQRFQRLAHYLRFGVYGDGPEKRGGVLFVGPARHRLDAGGRGELVLEPRNFSTSRAVFRAGGESVVLEPGEGGRLAVDVDSGSAVELEVEGQPRGEFLWGMPRIESAAAARALPPIVLVTLDTTRRDSLGPYNPDVDFTPQLDRLARHATVFDQAYSTAPWTLPSHASIMTGLYPSRHGAGVSRKALTGFPTLAALLRERGYFTAGFSSGELSSSRFGLARGFDLYRDPDAFETPGGRLAEYVDELLEGYGHLPLFLFVNYFDAHALYQAPPAWEKKLDVPALREPLRGQEAWDDLFDAKMGAWRRFVMHEVEVTPAGLDYLRSAYRAEVAYLDHLLGRLFGKLRQLGLYDRALIVVTADHGELLGEGGYFSHAARLDPELVEIPLLIKWPGQEEGRRSRRLVSLIDLFPTILHAAGIEPSPSDGRRLGAEPGAGEAHPFVFLEEHESLVHPLPEVMKISRHLFGVQRPGFRQLVWDGGQSCARRNGDGWDREDCASDAGNVLEAIRAQLGLVELEEGETPVLDEVRESLRALGYM